jgi:molecular chaperone HtpG
LQQEPEVEAIRNGLTKRVLDMLARMAKDEPEKYASFWKEFGAVIKEGVGQDYANRAALLGLLRFASTHEATNEPSVSFAQYVERMKPGQDKIYFVIGETLDAARSSPYIERLKSLGIEVLLLAERIDEWVMGQIDEFEGKRLKDVSRGDLELGALETEADKKQQEQELKENEGLLKRVKDAVGERIENVRVSTRLKDSPACLALGEHDMGANMRRILAATGQKVPESKPTLELNVGHPLVKYLEHVGDEGQFKELAQILYEQAALAEGSQLANPAEYVQRLNRLLVRLAGVQSGASA